MANKCKENGKAKGNPFGGRRMIKEPLLDNYPWCIENEVENDDYQLGGENGFDSSELPARLYLKKESYKGRNSQFKLKDTEISSPLDFQRMNKEVKSSLSSNLNGAFAEFSEEQLINKNWSRNASSSKKTLQYDARPSGMRARLSLQIPSHGEKHSSNPYNQECTREEFSRRSNSENRPTRNINEKHSHNLCMHKSKRNKSAPDDYKQAFDNPTQFNLQRKYQPGVGINQNYLAQCSRSERRHRAALAKDSNCYSRNKAKDKNSLIYLDTVKAPADLNYTEPNEIGELNVPDFHNHLRARDHYRNSNIQLTEQKMSRKQIKNEIEEKNPIAKKCSKASIRLTDHLQAMESVDNKTYILDRRNSRNIMSPKSSRDSTSVKTNDSFCDHDGSNNLIRDSDNDKEVEQALSKKKSNFTFSQYKYNSKDENALLGKNQPVGLFNKYNFMKDLTDKKRQELLLENESLASGVTEITCETKNGGTFLAKPPAVCSTPRHSSIPSSFKSHREYDTDDSHFENKCSSNSNKAKQNREQIDEIATTGSEQRNCNITRRGQYFKTMKQDKQVSTDIQTSPCSVKVTDKYTSDGEDTEMPSTTKKKEKISFEKFRKIIQETRDKLQSWDKNVNFSKPTSTQESECECEQEACSFIGAYLYMLYQNSCLCDVKVIVDNRTFLVHKIVLAAFSNVFCPGTTQPEPTLAFEIPGVRPDAVKEIFKYLYTSTMDLRDDIIEDVMSASLFLGLKEVIGIVEDVLMKPNFENCELYLRLRKKTNPKATIIDYPELYEKYFTEMEGYRPFLELGALDAEKLLQNPYVLVESEADTVRIIASWVAYNPVERVATAHHLLKNINFECIDPEQLEELCQKFHVVFSSSEAREILVNAFKVHAKKKCPPIPSGSQDQLANPSATSLVPGTPVVTTSRSPGNVSPPKRQTSNLSHDPTLMDSPPTSLRIDHSRSPKKDDIKFDPTSRRRMQNKHFFTSRDPCRRRIQAVYKTEPYKSWHVKSFSPNIPDEDEQEQMAWAQNINRSAESDMFFQDDLIAIPSASSKERNIQGGNLKPVLPDDTNIIKYTESPTTVQCGLSSVPKSNLSNLRSEIEKRDYHNNDEDSQLQKPKPISPKKILKQTPNCLQEQEDTSAPKYNQTRETVRPNRSVRDIYATARQKVSNTGSSGYKPMHRSYNRSSNRLHGRHRFSMSKDNDYMSDGETAMKVMTGKSPTRVRFACDALREEEEDDEYMSRENDKNWSCKISEEFESDNTHLDTILPTVKELTSVAQKELNRYSSLEIKVRPMFNHTKTYFLRSKVTRVNRGVCKLRINKGISKQFTKVKNGLNSKSFSKLSVCLRNKTDSANYEDLSKADCNISLVNQRRDDTVTDCMLTPVNTLLQNRYIYNHKINSEQNCNVISVRKPNEIEGTVNSDLKTRLLRHDENQSAFKTYTGKSREDCFLPISSDNKNDLYSQDENFNENNKIIHVGKSLTTTIAAYNTLTSNSSCCQDHHYISEVFNERSKHCTKKSTIEFDIKCCRLNEEPSKNVNIYKLTDERRDSSKYQDELLFNSHRTVKTDDNSKKMCNQGRHTKKTIYKATDDSKNFSKICTPSKTINEKTGPKLINDCLQRKTIKDCLKPKTINACVRPEAINHHLELKSIHHRLETSNDYLGLETVNDRTEQENINDCLGQDIDNECTRTETISEHLSPTVIFQNWKQDHLESTECLQFCPASLNTNTRLYSIEAPQDDEFDDFIHHRAVFQLP